MISSVGSLNAEPSRLIAKGGLCEKSYVEK